MSEPLTENLKVFAWAAGLLIALGMGWSELNQRIAAKAEAAQVNRLEQRVEQETRDAAAESRVNRILLCRMPEIRPDSHCEGFR